jgi:hypothetical protein
MAIIGLQKKFAQLRTKDYEQKSSVTLSISKCVGFNKLP